MAYNSDGYIMIDFTEVDFRRTNQTIDGLYKRCVDVIGTNKFILVINANGRTPLPATCSFTNNQYVIDTCIYMFAISSNDNLFIRRNDVPASDIIDDDSVSVDKTWSSNKIDSELDTKADTSALADYQPLLTAVSPISIENDNISVDLSGKQDVLTAGDNISIVNNIISADGIKILTFTGTGEFSKSIEFPEEPSIILSMKTTSANQIQVVNSLPFGWNEQPSVPIVITPTNQTTPAFGSCDVSFSGNIMTITGTTAARAFNSLNIITYIYYI